MSKLHHLPARMLASALLWVCLPAGSAWASSFSFGLMGDQPYSNALEAATDSLIQQINQDPGVKWILHVGDIKGGGEPCTNELLTRRTNQLRQSGKPLFLVPGDNEWTDCHRDSNGNYNSQERLSYLRKLVFNEPRSLGKTSLSLRQQTAFPFPEHLMWRQGSTLFITLNVPGSNNDLENPSSRKTTSADVERLFKRREKAVHAWLAEAEKEFDTAPGASTPPTETVIAIQGNPLDGSSGFFNDGYKNFMKRLVNYIDKTGRPVLLAHGDTHRFKWDQPPLNKFGGNASTNALFYRVEGWGHPFVNSWVKVTVTPGAEKPFQAVSLSLTASPAN